MGGVTRRTVSGRGAKPTVCQTVAQYLGDGNSSPLSFQHMSGRGVCVTGHIVVDTVFVDIHTKQQILSHIHHITHMTVYSYHHTYKPIHGQWLAKLMLSSNRTEIFSTLS